MDVTTCKTDACFTSDELKLISKDFSRLKGTVYLDYTGAALYPESVVKNASEDLLNNVYGNPHSGSVVSLATVDVIDSLRSRLLNYFNTNRDEYSIIFTSGATSGLKLIGESFSYCTKLKCNSGKLETGSNRERSSTEQSKELKERIGDEKSPLTNHQWFPLTPADPVEESGSFVYLEECHTSVLGLRSLADSRASQTVCLSKEDAFSILGGHDENDQESEEFIPKKDFNKNSLYVYPAQCNFSGYKYPLTWINRVKHGILNQSSCQGSNWYSLLDAASFVSTNHLDLSRYKPDFVTVSFYKMFGYPTGLGAVLVRNSSADVLVKNYYGGGTVFVALSTENSFVPRSTIHDRFEDGTADYLSMISLKHSLDWMEFRVPRGIEGISQHTFSIARYAVNRLRSLRHSNGRSVAVIYADSDYSDCNRQGAVVNFNVIDYEGNHIGFSKVQQMAVLYNIQLRTGCFCNPGACRRHLGLSIHMIKHQFQSGHVCGDDHDLIDGVPTGSVRVSFGPFSKHSDVDTLIAMVQQCFLSSVTEGADTIKDGNMNVCSTEAQPYLQHRMCNKIIGRLSEISLYPVKSCAKFSVRSWNLDATGLKYDRMWMIVKQDGTALTQKKEPRLCLIHPSIDVGSNKLTLSFGGHCDTSMSLDMPFDSKDSRKSNLNGDRLCRDSKVCQDQVKGVDCGDEAAGWLQLVLETPGLRLVRMVERSSKNQNRLSLANQAQYLLINKSSVNWLSERSNSGDTSLGRTEDRFRANFIVDSVGEPFSELLWPSVTIGENFFKIDGECRRCEMICIDQETGEKSKEPLRSLIREFGKLKFGIYLSLAGNFDGTCDGLISVGDDVVPQPRVL